MQTSKVIYRLSKLARLLDIDGGSDDVEALNIAVEYMNEKLKEEQINAASKHVLRVIPGVKAIKIRRMD